MGWCYDWMCHTRMIHHWLRPGLEFVTSTSFYVMEVLHPCMLSKNRSESSNTNMCLHDSLGSDRSCRKTHGASGMKSGTLSTIVHSPNSK